MALLSSISKTIFARILQSTDTFSFPKQYTTACSQNVNSDLLVWKLIPNRWIVLHFSKLDLLRPDVLRPVQNSKLMEPKIHLATRKVWKRRTGQPNSQVRRLHKRRTSGQNGQLQLLYLLLLISWHAITKSPCSHTDRDDVLRPGFRRWWKRLVCVCYRRYISNFSKQTRVTVRIAPALGSKNTF